MATRRGNTTVQQGRRVLKLSGSVTYHLTSLANKLSSGASRLYLERYGIGIIEWRLLAILAIEPCIAPTRICQVVGLDKGAVSRETRKLESKGYITVLEDPESPRRRTLELTPTGRALHDKILGTALERERRLLKGLSPDEVNTLLALLERTAANVADVNDFDPLPAKPGKRRVGGR